jgi:enolase
MIKITDVEPDVTSTALRNENKSSLHSLRSVIKNITAREILDSRGNPTVEATVFLSDGASGTASVPSGASTGAHEAWELRDGDKTRYQGKGVLKAIHNIETIIAPALTGKNVFEQQKLDALMQELDGTANKSALGANAILAVSLGLARAAANSQKIPLYRYLGTLVSYPVTLSPESFPVPMFNVINGGAHADSGLSVQEFKIVPRGISSYPKQLQAGSEIFHSLQKLLRSKGFTTDVGDEGGFAPRLESHNRAFEILVESITEARYTPGKEILLDVDIATDSFYKETEDCYQLLPENVCLRREQMIALYKEWLSRYPLFSLEDPLHQEDWHGWHELTKNVAKEVLIIGDDLLVTNTERLKIALEHGSCNTVLIKMNQIGTLSETIACVALAKEHDMKTIFSHRSGETCDDFLADFAVAAGADYIKTGSLSRGERVTKYNRLLAIYDELTH